MPCARIAAALGALALTLPCGAALAQKATAKPYQGGKPYQVEWVYKIRYGFQGEWWKIFQAYQIPILDREKQLGYVTDYIVQRPGLHTSEDARWDYRIIITYPDWAGTTHEGEVDRLLFADREAEAKAEQRRWELTLNHWDLPIHEIDPHQAP